MKVLLSTELLSPPLTGIGVYTLNLLRELQGLRVLEALDCFDGGHWRTAEQQLAHYRLSQANAGTAGQSWRRQLATRLRRMPMAYAARNLVRSRLFAKGLRRRSGFVYHEPNFVLKPFDGPSVATVHDLSFIHYPQYHPAERVAWIERELPRTLARAACIITDSERVRGEVMREFSLPADRVQAIHLGVDGRFLPRDASQTRSVLARYGLQHGGYVAFVSTLEPRKGLATLLDAWQQLPDALQRRFRLVIAGAPGWGHQDLLARVQRLAATGKVLYLNYVAAEDLPVLYAGAAAFVYPSTYEGFGLPVLEAMASGTPVVCAEQTAMVEFSEGAARFFRAESSDSLADVLRTLLEDEALRISLGQRGPLQAARYTWERCARETLSVYQRLASQA